MRLTRQMLTTMLLIASIIFTQTACGPDTIAKAEKASAKLASYADKGVNVTRQLYRENIINLATKDAIADGFIRLADAGLAFDVAVRNAKAAYGENVPATEVERLFAVFDSQVVAQFLAVLQSYKLIADAPALAAVIASVKAAVLVIADAFGKKVQTQAKLA